MLRCSDNVSKNSAFQNAGVIISLKEEIGIILAIYDNSIAWYLNNLRIKINNQDIISCFYCLKSELSLEFNVSEVFLEAAEITLKQQR